MIIERRTLTIRNPDRPGREVLPCELTISEQQHRWQRVAAIMRQRAQIDAEEAAAKAKAKRAREELGEEHQTLWREIDTNKVERAVECEYLVDDRFMYVLRLDTMRLVRRRELTKDERAAARQGDLFAADAPTRTLDVPDTIETVRRFDEDTPDVGAAEEDGDEDDGGEANGHEHTWNEGACVTCGVIEDEAAEPAEVQATKPVRRKGRGKGYDARAVEAH